MEKLFNIIKSWFGTGPNKGGLMIKNEKVPEKNKVPENSNLQGQKLEEQVVNPAKSLGAIEWYRAHI